MSLPPIIYILFFLQTRKGFFWDDPFFTNVWEDFEKLRSDIWKGNQDFFSRFQQTRQDQQVNSLQHSRNLTFNRNSFESDSDFGLSRRWLMPKGIFDEDSANFQLKVRVLKMRLNHMLLYQSCKMAPPIKTLH